MGSLLQFDGAFGLSSLIDPHQFQLSQNNGRVPAKIKKKKKNEK